MIDWVTQEEQRRVVHLQIHQMVDLQNDQHFLVVLYHYFVLCFQVLVDIFRLKVYPTRPKWAMLAWMKMAGQLEVMNRALNRCWLSFPFYGFEFFPQF